MNFTKMQGAGNDFVLVETSDNQCDWSRVALAMCDRHFGVGADGLLLLLPSDVADFKMRVFNTDGTEAEACGNGLRCLVKYIVDRGLGGKRQEMSIETMAGTRRAKLYKTNNNPKRIQLGMGKPMLGAKDIPVAIEQESNKLVDIKSMLSCSVTVEGKKMLLNPVSIGNPHAVYFSQQPVADFPLLQLGPKVEHHRIFPIGVNFEVARVINRQQIEARVWERGVGETLACGSGACAITVAAQLHGYIDNRVDIKLPGGTLHVEWDGAGEIFLSGPAEIVFTGEWLSGDIC